LRSAFWYYHAQKVLPFSQSAYIVGIIIAIEVLMPKKDDTSKICEKCKRSFDGTTKRFINFVEKHITDQNTDDDFKKLLTELYRLRSRFAHGGELLRIDEELSFILNPVTAKEKIVIERISLIAKIVMINWLKNVEPSHKNISKW